MGSAFPGGATAHGRGWVAVQGRCRRARRDPRLSARARRPHPRHMVCPRLV